MGQLINIKQFLSDISDGQTTESILETLTDIEQDMAVFCFDPGRKTVFLCQIFVERFGIDQYSDFD